MLVISSNSIKFVKQVDDPIFAAHQPYQIVEPDFNSNVTVFGADEPGATVTCTEQVRKLGNSKHSQKLTSLQYQFCNPAARFHSCTKLNALGLATQQIKDLSLNARQNATAWLMKEILGNWNNDMSLISITYPNPLKAHEELQNWLSQPLPPNQWEIEVQGWEAYILATLQQTIASYAVGPGLEYSSGVMKPVETLEQELCGRQKMKAPNGFKYALWINIFCVS